jgi:hypothetical protein
VWDAPYRSLFWDQNLMQPWVETLLGMSWQQYATHPMNDQIITLLIRATGVLYAVCAGILLLSESWIIRLRKILVLGSLAILFLAFLRCREKGFDFGFVFECACQVIAPWLLYALLVRKVELFKLEKVLKLAIAATFLGHGLYAIGYYPIPGQFIDMTIRTLGVSQSTAVTLLALMGLMDIAIALFIFEPRVAPYFLGYASFWGFATALARPWAYFNLNFALDSLNQWLPEMFVRMPHAGLPFLALLIMVWSWKRTQASAAVPVLQAS